MARLARGVEGFGKALKVSPARLVASTTALFGACPSMARAGVLDGAAHLVAHLEPHEWAVFGLNIGLVVATISASIALLRARRALAERARESAETIDALDRAAQRSEQLLTLDGHVVVVWGEGEEPTISGDPMSIADLPAPRRVLAFGAWLPPVEASRLEAAVEVLRADGAPFRLDLVTTAGRPIEADGLPIGGRAVLRLKEVSGVKAELSALAQRHRALTGETEVMRGFLAAVPAPAWMRDAQGRLIWVNAAYAKAVEAVTAAGALAAGAEFLDKPSRAEAALARREGGVFAKRVALVAAGARRVFDVVDLPVGGGSAGFAADVTEIEAMRSRLVHEMDAHKRTFDQLASAVAIFDANKRLVFHNEAYRQLWGLDAAFLHQGPRDGEILERLRETRRLPEQRDFRAWMKDLHEVYQAPTMEPRNETWHLPGGQTLRVILNPDPSGGVTYVFEDMTERLKLESRVTTVAKTQREVIDTLDEAVAVFGPEGRLALHNPAFLDLWDVSAKILEARPALDDVVLLCAAQVKNGQSFREGMQAAATLTSKGRVPKELQVERLDGTIVDVRTAPLPDGGTLATFRNVTDRVAIERALKDKNEALETAARIKSTFVQHVSYQLRTPLNSIIGFADLLDEPSIGPLNAKQREYLDYITASSGALRSIIDDVLDLASVDAGTMELQIGAVDPAEIMRAAIEPLADQIAAHRIRVETRLDPALGVIAADPGRLRQVLFNLASNAIGFSPDGGLVVLEAKRGEHDAIFVVRDNGQGVAPEIRDAMFDRFESRTVGTRHRGAGLGLAIVEAFVKLHGGRIEVDSTPGRGTSVAVLVPLRLAGMSKAAE